MYSYLEKYHSIITIGVTRHCPQQMIVGIMSTFISSDGTHFHDL